MLIDNIVTVIAEAIVGFLRRTRFRIVSGPVSIEMELKAPISQRNIDLRLAKIESARASLSEALSAMDDLKFTAESNKRDLERLTAAISQAETEKAGLHAQLDALKQIAALDSEAVRQALRMPGAVDIWRERIYGFIIGVLAAVVGTLIWEFGLKAWLERPAPTEQHQSVPTPAPATPQ